MATTTLNPPRPSTRLPAKDLDTVLPLVGRLGHSFHVENENAHVPGQRGAHMNRSLKMLHDLPITHLLNPKPL